MKAREIFEAAVRIVGFLTAFLSLIRFLNELPDLSRSSSAFVLDGPIYTWQAFAIEFVIAVLGVALMFGGRFVADVVYGGKNSN
ncbi:MAG TPA: hypothetical protein VII56_07305 [Rhizomicrobium sp.]